MGDPPGAAASGPENHKDISLANDSPDVFSLSLIYLPFSMASSGH